MFVANLANVKVWAIALSGDGQYLAGVSQDGRVGVWDLSADGTQIRDHETKGSFGTCIDLVGPRRVSQVALSIANNHSLPMDDSLPLDTRMVPFISLTLRLAACHSLCQVCYTMAPDSWRLRWTNNWAGIVKPVRAVAFSPGSKILAVAGDSKVIVLYDTSSGEQIANLSGHSAWVLSLSWSSTGEYLLSRSVHQYFLTIHMDKISQYF